ncbi:MAG TPA: AGE family epimerase/isomerase [Victivallis vadensis]|nr:AGE family epimerase/isomerase [Victivallis vadensis]
MNKRKTFSKNFRQIIESSLNLILNRYDQHPGYGYLDTKFDLLTQRDYFNTQRAEDILRSGQTIYSWIQGRGLESLAEHYQAGFGNPKCILRILQEVCDNLQKCRIRNAGRMFFMMTPDGQWLNPNGTLRNHPLTGDANYSDLFVAKGLLHAAASLEDSALQHSALVWLRQITEAIAEFRFVTDQQTFDPANPITIQPDKVLLGPFMICLSGITKAAELTKDCWWLDRGCDFIRRILTFHVKWFRGIPDVFEAVHKDGSPWIEDEKLLCDPGHTLEFIGLAQKFLFVLEHVGRTDDIELIERCRQEFPLILSRVFRQGFFRESGGIVKSIDLLTQQPINSDMPWWSLPETIRAAAENEIFSKIPQHEIIDICSEVFWKYYTIPRYWYFAWQTRDKAGKPTKAIPAVPDLDPGYHTNLCLIDILKLWRNLR